MSIMHEQGRRSVAGNPYAVILLRFAVVLTTLALGLATPQSLGAQALQGSLQPLTAAQAKDYVGRIATVCGTVANAKYAAASRGAPTFLNLDRPYPQQIFTVVVWGTDRPRLGTPETEYLGKRICVTGRVESYRGIPEIIVREKAQITVSGAVGTPQGQAVPPTSLAPSAGKRKEGEALLRHFMPGRAHTVRFPVIPHRVLIAAGGCVSACQDDYEAEAESCKSLHGEDPEEADDFQMCIQNAKDEYDSCKEACEEEEEEEEEE